MYLVNKITGLSDKLYLWKEQPDWYLLFKVKNGNFLKSVQS